MTTPFSRIIGAMACTALLVAGWSLSAAAQPGGGGGGGRMSPEEATAIWKDQAGSVAHEMGLADDLAGKLADAYVASRKSQQAALRESGGGGGGRRGEGDGGGGGRERFEAMRAANEAEAAKLSTALGAFLDEAQTKTAVATLGAYDRQWDRLVGVLASLKLEDAKKQEGLAVILKHTGASIKARDAAMASGDFRAVRGAMEEIKKQLDTDMAAVLSAEQLATWKEQTEMRRGGGGRGPGGGGGEGGREGGRGRGGDPDGQQL